MDEKPSVLVVGAGVSGLLLAQALKKEGFAVSVVEQESSAEHARPREWGMSIQWALPLLADVLPALLFTRLKDEATVDPGYEPPDPGELPTLNAQTGELIKNLPLVKVYRVSRRKFRKLLAEGIDIQYGKKLKGVDNRSEGITAKFEDGSSSEAQLLVGADGARSVVRSILFGGAATVDTVSLSAINTHVCYNDAGTARFLRKWHPVYTMGIHPAGYWEVPDSDRPETWVFQLQYTWKSKPGEQAPSSLPALKERAADFAEPFRTAFLKIPEGTPIYENKMAYWVPEPWDSRGGRVTLVGDAAHPMTFHRGQGLNHCIADVAKLTAELTKPYGDMGENEGKDKGEGGGGGDLIRRLEAYTTESVARGGEEVRISLKNTHMLHDWDMLLQSPLMQRGAAPGGG